MVINFGGDLRKLEYPTFTHSSSHSLTALAVAFREGSQDGNDMTVMAQDTLDRNLVSCVPVTSEFTTLVCVVNGQNYALVRMLCAHAGLCNHNVWTMGASTVTFL